MSESITETLADHPYTWPDSFCACGAYVGSAPWRDHAEHVAGLLAPVVSAVVDQALAEAADAVRDMADSARSDADHALLWEAAEVVDGCREGSGK